MFYDDDTSGAMDGGAMDGGAMADDNNAAGSGAKDKDEEMDGEEGSDSI